MSPPNESASPELSVVVVSYGTRAMTLAALASVERETCETTCELIVVDNASTDDSAAAIAVQFPQARLLTQVQNLGFGTACNLAAGGARGEFILLLNPDTLVKDRAIDRLMKFARERPHAGIWGGRTLFPDGRLNPTSCWRRQSLWNLFCSASGLTSLFPNSALFHSAAYGGWARDSVREVDIVSGCFLLISRELWCRLGGFSTKFFVYGEDADLCLRAKQMGYRPAITPDATIVHYGSGTDEDRTRKISQVFTSRVLLIRRHIEPWKQPLAMALLMMIPLIGLLTGRAASRDTWRNVWRQRHVWAAGRYG